VSVVVLLDLSAALDAIDQNIVLQRFELKKLVISSIYLIFSIFFT